MSDQLFQAVQKLASDQPELRAHLVPLLRKHAGGVMPDVIIMKPWYRREFYEWDVYAVGGLPELLKGAALKNIWGNAATYYKVALEDLQKSFERAFKGRLEFEKGFGVNGPVFFNPVNGSAKLVMSAYFNIVTASGDPSEFQGLDQEIFDFFASQRSVQIETSLPSWLAGLKI